MSRLPKEILEAPPEYLHDEMIKAFGVIGYGSIPLWTNHGCAMFVHVDRKTIKDCKHAVHDIKLELHEIDSCPLIRFDIKVYDRVDDPLRMDAFLNIQDEGQLAAAEALGEQEWIVFHWYDENLIYVRSSGVRWSKDNQDTAFVIVRNAKRLVEENGGGDFDRAKAKFIRDNPLD